MLRAFVFLALIIFPVASAQAACSGPAGDAGDILYNEDHSVLQWCDGTDWIGAPKPSGGGGPTGCDNIGDLCSDGSYYIGQVGGTDIYATASASESSPSWNNGTSNWTGTGFTSTTDGPGNTAGLVALSDAGSPYEAAEYCDGLSVHGSGDWYLPARDELSLFWNGGTPVAGVLTGTGNWYWSSTEVSVNNARVLRFSDGSQNSDVKGNGRLVRCVRRPGASGNGCTDPTGDAGDIVYNEDHTVLQWCDGSQWIGLPKPKIKWHQISAGGGVGDHSCGVATNGTAWCWGSGERGQLGNGTTSANEITPVQVGTSGTSTLWSDWVKISAGWQHTCGLRSDGTTWCWGYGLNGRLGTGSTAQRTTPTRVGTAGTSTLWSDWTDIEASNGGSCGIRTDGTAWCWGSGSLGRLGNGTTGDVSTPVQVLEASSAPSGCANIGDLCSDGSYYIGQIGGTGIYATAAASEGTQTWNNGTANWPTTGFTSTTDGPGNTAGLVALSDTGAPYAAAEYCDGLTNVHGHSDWYLPAKDELHLFWNGGSPVAGVNTSGSWYWSSTEWNNTNAWVQKFSDGSQSGFGKGSNVLVRCVRRVTSPTTGWDDWVELSSYSAHACGVRENGTAWCWGAEQYGKLGNGLSAGAGVHHSLPVQVLQEGESPGGAGWNDWVSISAGYNHTCGRRADDTAWCFGSNTGGLLGAGPVAAQSTPVRVGTSGTGTLWSDWMHVSVKRDHSCGYRENDTAWCWGSGTNGRLGNGDIANQNTPVQVQTDVGDPGWSDWIDISAGGGEQTCGIRDDNTSWCWGNGSAGQRGDDSTTDTQTTPVEVVNPEPVGPCTAPAGDAGDILYNSDHSILQWCDGRQWIGWPLPPCEEGPLGTVCADGAVYAGETVGGARMYVADADQGGTHQWKTTNSTTAGTGSTSDGLGNTDAMATAGLADHPAGQACRNRGADWYLPAIDELGMLYDNRAQLGAANLPTSSSYYWSSSENSSFGAKIQQFSSGSQGNTDKIFTNLVRCVRR